MPEQVKLTEVETYKQEALNAEREGRPCKLRDPRDVFKDDPNRDSYLEEKPAKDIKAEQKEMDKEAEAKLTNLGAVRDGLNENRDEEVSPEITDAIIDERLPSTDPGEYQRQVELEHGLSEETDNTPHVDSLADEAAADAQVVNDELALDGNDTESEHQNTQSTPNPVFEGGKEEESTEPETTESETTPAEENADEGTHNETLPNSDLPDLDKI